MQFGFFSGLWRELPVHIHCQSWSLLQGRACPPSQLSKVLRCRPGCSKKYSISCFFLQSTYHGEDGGTSKSRDDARNGKQVINHYLVYADVSLVALFFVVFPVSPISISYEKYHLTRVFIDNSS